MNQQEKDLKIAELYMARAAGNTIFRVGSSGRKMAIVETSIYHDDKIKTEPEKAMTEASEIKVSYFAVNLACSGFFYKQVWRNDTTDNRLLERGLVFRTSKGATAKTKEILKWIEENR